jgi:release factor glutamine methyltransferase
MAAALSMPTPAELLRTGSARLQAAGSDTARLDAEVLLAFALQIDRTALYARLHSASDAALERRFDALVERRSRREPIAYITGTQEFWSLQFAVNPAVLIPRPETELLVEIVKEKCGGAEVRRCGGTAPATVELSGTAGGPPAPRVFGGGSSRTSAPPHLRTPLSIADLGTGSGCIAIALARELPTAQIVALDVSADALAVASANAAAHGVADRIAFRHSDLFASLVPDERFDVIVSNPPYCRPDDPTSPEVAFEPRAALMAGSDGLAVIRRLLSAVPQRLRPGGWLVMEFGRGQDADVRADAAAAGLTDIAIRADLAGIPRALVARRA